MPSLVKNTYDSISATITDEANKIARLQMWQLGKGSTFGQQRKRLAKKVLSVLGANWKPFRSSQGAQDDLYIKINPGTAHQFDTPDSRSELRDLVKAAVLKTTREHPKDFFEPILRDAFSDNPTIQTTYIDSTNEQMSISIKDEAVTTTPNKFRRTSKKPDSNQEKLF